MRLRTTPPGRHVALYDGRCAFCRAGVARMRTYAEPGAIAFVDLHAGGALDAFPGLTHEACMGSLHLVLPDGDVVRGAEAVARVILTRPVVGAVAWLYYVPGLRHLFDLAYRHFARRRYALFGAAEECDAGGCRLP